MVTGPLDGLRVLELAAHGPVPFAAALLANLGAQVTRVDRPVAQGVSSSPAVDVFALRQRAVTADLKDPRGVEFVLDLVSDSDILLEGLRPGVMERLGVGPEACLTVNPALVYGRMTGWGQRGPLAHCAGHDINFLALSGVLGAIGAPDQPPPPPLNLLGDYGAGGMLLVTGVLSAVVEARSNGRGQVVDASIIGGLALMSANLHARDVAGTTVPTRESNVLDGGAPYYRAYECGDYRYIAVGAIERQFSVRFLKVLGLSTDKVSLDNWYDPYHWPRLRREVAAIVRQQTRDEWVQRFGGVDACVTPVLSLREARDHPHLSTVAERQGAGSWPATVPRFTTPRGHSRQPTPALGPNQPITMPDPTSIGEQP